MGLLLASLEEERRQERGRFFSKLEEVLIEVLCSQNPILPLTPSLEFWGVVAGSVLWFKVWVLQICCGLWCWRRRWKKIALLGQDQSRGSATADASLRLCPSASAHLPSRQPAISALHYED